MISKAVRHLSSKTTPAPRSIILIIRASSTCAESASERKKKERLTKMDDLTS